MRRYQADTVMHCSPDVVFAYVSDLARHSEWSANTLRLEQKSESGSGVGARFVSRGRQVGIENPNEVLVVEHEPPRRVAFEVRGREGVFLHAFDIEDVPGGARVTKSFEVRNVTFPLSLLGPLFVLFSPRGLRKDLQRIKRALEEEA